jgi:DNA-binding NtrC family response regulator
VGSSHEIPINVRVISATHRNLDEMCAAETFRRDLYFRLNPVMLKVPPLRERQDEIEPLAHYFLMRASEFSGLPPKRLDPEALKMLMQYHWPGNVRELRNAMERAVLIAAGDTITVNDLPTRVRATMDVALRHVQEPTPFLGHPKVEQSEFKNKMRLFESALICRALKACGGNKKAAAQRLQMPLRTLMYKVQTYALGPEMVQNNDFLSALPAEAVEERDPGDFRTRIRNYEMCLLLEALKQSAWNKAETARRLGLPLSTVLYKIRSYGLDNEPP